MTQTEENKNTQKLPAKPPLSSRLMARLEETLEQDYSVMPPGVMVEQAQILDMAFRRGIHSALSGSIDAFVFHAALKAQDQYRRTVKTLESYDSGRGCRPKT